MLVLLRKYMFDWVESLKDLMSDIWSQTGRFEKWLAAFMGVILRVADRCVGTAPQVRRADVSPGDAANLCISQGKITHIPWLVMTGMPQCTEMLYTLAIWLGGLPAAAVTGWLIGVTALFGIIAFFQTGFEKGSRLGWVAAASLLAGETFATSLSWAYIDWMGLLFRGLLPHLPVCLVQF